jgi:2-oxo-3-hexenedioate decarboxylase/2-keto-4-pentenoate hydratase
MSDTTHLQAAAFIVEHRLSKRRLPALAASIRPPDVDHGYRVQALANEKLTQAGLGTVAGHKVGSTNPAVQRALGMPHPIGGSVFASTVHNNSARVRHADYVRPGVECEVVLLLGSDLPARAAPYSRAEVVAAIAACAAGIEIIDDRYEDIRALGAPSLIADNGLDAGVILGAPVSEWRALDLPAAAASISVNGRIVAQGSGANVMDDPINVLIWLANDRARRGLGLRAGEFVFTGSMTDIVWVQSGDQVETAIAGLGGASCAFL